MGRVEEANHARGESLYIKNGFNRGPNAFYPTRIATAMGPSSSNLHERRASNHQHLQQLPYVNNYGHKGNKQQGIKKGRKMRLADSKRGVITKTKIPRDAAVAAAIEITTALPLSVSSVPDAMISNAGVPLPSSPSSMVSSVAEALVGKVVTRALKTLNPLHSGRGCASSAAKHGTRAAAMLTKPLKDYDNVVPAAKTVIVDALMATVVGIKDAAAPAFSLPPPPTAAGDLIMAENKGQQQQQSKDHVSNKKKRGRRMVKKQVLYYSSSL